MALGEIIWLITLLANQPILIHNLKHKDDKQELLTEEEVELLTSPMDFGGIQGRHYGRTFKGDQTEHRK